MRSPTERPFVCDGDPRSCAIFIVGANPATATGFWRFWSDDTGCDRRAFIDDYLDRKGSFKGVRQRIEAVVAELPRGSCLETNLWSVPTRRLADLVAGDRRTAVFDFLLATLRPRIVLTHSALPARWFRRRFEIADGRATQVERDGHCFTLVTHVEPFFRTKLADARRIGRQIAARL